MIEKLLNGMKDAVSTVNRETAQAMYEAMEATLHASKFDRRTRQARFLRLLMKCASAGNQKEMMGKFTTALLAADYYFSVGCGNKAIPHLKLAISLFQEQYGGPLLSEDKDAIIGTFRSQNLKGKFRREFNAVRNVYVLSGAAHQLGLDLPLDELPADYCPNITSIKSFLFILVMSLAGVWMVLNAFNEYRAARFAGEPIPFLDALQPAEIPIVVVGFILVVTEFILLFWQYTPNYNRWMAKYYYWRFSH